MITAEGKLPDIDHLEYLWSRLIVKNIENNGGDLYSGEVGHCFFLYTYWIKEKNIEKASQLSQKVLDVLERVLGQEFSAGFFQGTMGSLSILFKIIKAMEVSLDPSVIKKVAKKTTEVSIVGINDICNGNSGTLYGLFFLMEYLPELGGELKKRSAEFLNYLLASAKFSKDGIYWDITPFQSRSLCGFSHGNSGIAFVFSEIGKLLNNDFLVKIAKSAINHEDSFYRSDMKNWPDFRMPHTELLSLKNKLLKNDLLAFDDIGDTKGWCHGFPGVAISRHSILCIYNDPKTAVKLKRLELQLLDLIREWKADDDIGLCHGLSGLLLILESISSSNSRALYAIDIEKAHKNLLDNIFNDSIEKGDFGLFNSLLGVYYYLLRFQCLDECFNILAPKLNHKEKLNISIINEESFVKMKARHLFENYLTDQQLELFIKDLNITEKYSFEDFFNSALRSLRPIDRETKIVGRLMLLRKDYLSRDRDINGLYTYLKDLLVIDSIKIDVVDWMHSKYYCIVVPKGVYVIKSKRDDLGNLIEKDAPAYLTIPQGRRVLVIKLSFLTEIIIQKAYQHNELSTLIFEVLKSISSLTEEDLCCHLVENQVDELRRIGALIILPIYEN